MPITPWIPAVSKVANKTNVSAEVVNPILDQYAQRTQHLYEKFSSFAGRSVLMAYDHPLLDGAITAGDVVFFDKSGSTSGLSLAQTEFVTTDLRKSAFTIANSSFSCGIVESVTGSTANVYLYGIVELATRIDDPTNGLLVSNQTVADVDVDTTAFEPGPLYLSGSEAGKLTRNPGGIAVYVGYAIDRYSLLLAPHVNEFSNLFTQYHYNVLDRPAGLPVLTGTTWTISDVDLAVVGWIPAAIAGSSLGYTVPTGAKFFYNLPSATDIAADTGILAAERDEQAGLALALPPFPPNLSMLTINGVIQISKDFTESDGIYKLDQYGIWWFDDQDMHQPWATDIPDDIPLTVDHTTDTFTATAHLLENDTKVKLRATVVPTGLSTATTYYIVNAAANTFQLSLTPGGAVVTFSDNGTLVSVPQPYIWSWYRATLDEARARMYLQFLKMNPDFRRLFVTSIEPFVSTNGAIKYYSKADPTVTATAGDLLAKLDLQFPTGTTANSNRAVSNLTYSATTGKVTVGLTPVISEITGIGGISVVENGAGTGKYILTSSLSGVTGSVSMEPENAELEYTGLHSYLNLVDPAVLPTGFTGKFQLPSAAIASNVAIVLMMFGKSNLSTSDTIDFDFTYSVSSPGTLINSTVTSSVVSIPVTTAVAANTAFVTPEALIVIPSSAVQAGSVVNFRLMRRTTSYTADLGLIEANWKVT